MRRPCDGAGCASEERQHVVENADRAFARLGQLRGKIMQYLPDLAFVRVKLGAALEGDLAYSLIVDKAYRNVSSMFSEQKPGDERDTSADRQTVLPWLEGSHPEFFFVLDGADVERFVAQYSSIQSREDAQRFLDRFGMRRTQPRFWQASDWFNAEVLREQPERGGIFDLNRYWNL